jgi:periplasmic protein TonB
MSDKHIEKTFPYLVLLSTLFHVAVFSVFSLIPPEPRRIPEETTMVELNNLPDPPTAKPESEPKPKPEPKLKSEAKPRQQPVPLPRPLATPKPTPVQVAKVPLSLPPKGARVTPSKSVPDQVAKTEPNPQTSRSPVKIDSAFHAAESGGKEAVRSEGLFKPHQGTRDGLAKLFPSARNMGKMEESFREKYQDAEHGDTRLMDTNDPVIGVFTHRYYVATLQQLRAIDQYTHKGLGRTILNVTFKRDGTISNIKILYSSGNKALDELAIKASRTASYVGPLPKGWNYEEYNIVLPFVIEEGRASTGWEMTE